LLLVLSIDSGVEFPSAIQGSVLQVKAHLDEAWLESGEVPASTNPHFGTDLAWEVGEEQLKELRRQRASVQVEVWRNSNELLGHQMMDVRTAVALAETDTPATSLHKLKGCSTANLRLGLGLAVLPGEEGGHFVLKPGEEGVEELQHQIKDLPEAPGYNPSMLKQLDDQISQMMDELECPVCFHECSPPIYTCEAQHLICANCRPKLQKCGICWAPYQKMLRHRYAEKEHKQLTDLCSQRDLLQQRLAKRNHD